MEKFVFPQLKVKLENGRHLYEGATGAPLDFLDILKIRELSRDLEGCGSPGSSKD